MVRIPEGSAPDMKNKSFKITAKVEIPESGAEGVLMTQGGRFNGLGLYVLGGKPVFHYNLCGVDLGGRRIIKKEMDRRARELEGEWLRDPAAPHLEFDGRPRLPTQLLHRIVLLPPLGRAAIDRDDLVTGLDAGAHRLGVGQPREHDDPDIPHFDTETQAPVVPR